LSAFSIASLLASIISFILGIFVYLKNTKSVVNRTWLFLSINVSIWSLGIFALHNSPDHAHAFFWIRFMYCGSIFVPSSFLHLIFSVSEIHHDANNRKIIITSYLISIILLIFNFTPLFVKGVGPRLNFKYYTIPGILFPFFGIFYLSNLVIAFYKLLKEFPRVSAVKRNQLKYILIASSVGFAGAISTIFPMFNIKTPPIGYYLILFYTLIVSYAIVKHQLMDINIVFKRGMVYAYLSFFVLLPCMVVTILAQKFFFNQINYFFSFLTFCTLLLASLVFLKVTPEIEEYIEKRLFKSKFEYKKTLRELIEIIVSYLDEKELFKKAGNILTKDLGAENVSFFLLDKEKKAYTLRASKNLQRSKVKELPLDDPLFQWLQEKGKAVVREETEKIINDLQIKSVVKRMESMESEVCIPLISRDQLIGIINLGHKRSGDMYSHEDLDLLTHFATQASVALENARLYQEMQKTHQLMRRTDRLSALGSLTAGLAHEIRNPLVTIKTFLDLVPEFAKPKKPAFMRTDVNQVIQETIPLIQVEARKRDIALKTNLQETPLARLDPDQMKQVFLNILLNALDAIKSHGTVSITTRDIHRNGSVFVQVEITDTGKGIPKKLIDQIFDPFFTTKDKGAGLGLAISHQIIDDHHGFIEVQSVPKKGTTFFVNIPR
jgi:K+-sensing histidine kinase KdpD